MAHEEVLFNLLKNIKHCIGAEVGVHTGDTTKYLLQNLPTIEKYYAIDPWRVYTMYDGNKYRKPGNKKYKTWVEAIEQFKKVTLPYKNKVIALQMTSVEASKTVLDGSLDWVFIDANHEYEYIKENLKIWSSKVKLGGLVSGHDYGNKWKGIKRAVNEYIPKYKLKISPYYVWSFIKGE